MKRVAIYARVSTADKRQDLDTKLIPLQKYARSRGWEIFRIYADNVSGAANIFADKLHSGKRIGYMEYI